MKLSGRKLPCTQQLLVTNNNNVHISVTSKKDRSICTNYAMILSDLSLTLLTDCINDTFVHVSICKLPCFYQEVVMKTFIDHFVHFDNILYKGNVNVFKLADDQQTVVSSSSPVHVIVNKKYHSDECPEFLLMAVKICLRCTVWHRFRYIRT